MLSTILYLSSLLLTTHDLSTLYETVHSAVVVVFTQEAKLQPNTGITKTITSEA